MLTRYLFLGRFRSRFHKSRVSGRQLPHSLCPCYGAIGRFNMGNMLPAYRLIRQTRHQTDLPQRRHQPRSSSHVLRRTECDNGIRKWKVDRGRIRLAARKESSCELTQAGSERNYCIAEAVNGSAGDLPSGFLGAWRPAVLIAVCQEVEIGLLPYSTLVPRRKLCINLHRPMSPTTTSSTLLPLPLISS